MTSTLFPIALKSQRTSPRVPCWIELDLRDLRAHAERSLAMLLLAPIDQLKPGEIAVGPVLVLLGAKLRFDAKTPNTSAQDVYAHAFGKPTLVVRQDGTCTLEFTLQESDDGLRCIVPAESFIPALRPLWHFVPVPVTQDADEPENLPTA